jgi:hypothetical protein
MYYPKSQIRTNLYTNGQEYILKYDGSNYVGYYWKTSSGRYYTGKTPQDQNSQEIVLSAEGERLQSNQTVTTQGKTATITLTHRVLSAGPDSPPLAYNEDLVVSYMTLNNISTANPPVVDLPTYTAPPPSESDYMIGEFRRYFCKKANELIYLEINKDTYDRLQGRNPNILWKLYIPFYLPWTLVGEKQKVYTTNNNIVQLTIQKNKLPKFADFLKFDYLKYYRG